MFMALLPIAPFIPPAAWVTLRITPAVAPAPDAEMTMRTLSGGIDEPEAGIK